VTGAAGFFPEDHRMTTLHFGLTADDVKRRASSIGASDARYIVNGTDEQIDHIWRVKRGEIAADDAGPFEGGWMYKQFGQYSEGFQREVLRIRTERQITQEGEEIRHPDYPGQHVTLDGFFEDLDPVVYADFESSFKWSWGCDKPGGIISAPVEMKWRNARQFSLEQQVSTFAPQCHQAMALTETQHCVLSTLTSDLVIYAHVMPFDPMYWAECCVRISDFQEAVEKGRAPRRFKRVGAPELAKVEAIMRSVDMTTHRKANEFLSWEQTLLSCAPLPDESGRASGFDKAKKALKGMLDADIGIAKGRAITIKRNRGGALSFEIDAEAVRKARAESEAREEMQAA
jgi:hypothetical protein